MFLELKWWQTKGGWKRAKEGLERSFYVKTGIGVQIGHSKFGMSNGLLLVRISIESQVICRLAISDHAFQMRQLLVVLQLRAIDNDG